MKLVVGSAPTNHSSTPTALSLTTLGVVTRDRPAMLERMASSYARGIRQHGRELRLLVLDDSADPAMRQENKARLLAVQRDTAVDIHYIDPQARQVLAAKLVDQGLVSPELAQFALLDGTPLAPFRNAGLNRNALLLATVGEAVFSADDDTCHQIFTPGDQATNQLTLSVNEDPAQKFYFASEQAAVDSLQRQENLDMWAAHEAILGQGGERWLSGTEAQSLPAALSTLQGRLQQPHGRVVSTVNGLVGDCGLAFPFGLTGTAVGCLYQPDPSSHRAFVASESHYQMATTTRHIVRLAPHLALSDGSYFMTTTFALDNRRKHNHLLPPFIPVFRAEDMIWGQTVWRTDPTALIAHLPLAVRHTPAQDRRFWPGEILRSASGYDTTRLLLDCLMAFPAIGDSNGYDKLVDHLLGLSGLPLQAFAQFLQSTARQRNELFLTAMEAALTEHNHQPAYWANDMKRYMQTMRQAMRVDDYIVPVDLRLQFRPRQALALGQDVLRLWAELLQAWPDMMTASHALHQKEQGMTRPLASAISTS
jgi:hypothetical protein